MVVFFGKCCAYVDCCCCFAYASFDGDYAYYLSHALFLRLYIWRDINVSSLEFPECSREAAEFGNSVVRFLNRLLLFLLDSMDWLAVACQCRRTRFFYGKDAFEEEGKVWS